MDLELLKFSSVALCCTLMLVLCGCVTNKQASINNELALSASSGNANEASRLLASGAKVNARDEDGNTPLHAAAFLEHADVAELLIAKGAEVNAKNLIGNTPLHGAASQGNMEVAELLIAKGADVNAKGKISGKNGYTPLHIAARNGEKDIVELLIAKGVDVNAINEDGRTPLAYAIDKGRNAVAEMLRQHGGK